jgi:hypothetical protein
MGDASLTRRMIHYFERQIAWFEEWTSQLPAIDDELDEEVWAALAGRLGANQAQSDQLEEEFELLKREWHGATEISAEERERVVALAQRAQHLADELAAWFQRGAAATTAEGQSVKAELEKLRKGRRVLDGYGGHRERPSSFIDRQA